ncbi:MAG TPA: putative Ig domain-containing protein [Chitinimonas sp.]
MVIWLCRLVLLALLASLPLAASSPTTKLLLDGASTGQPANSVPSVGGPAEAQCRADKIAVAPRCGPDGQPLQLEATPIYLPAATVGKAYRYAIKASGGALPYRFQLQDGSLPVGIALSEQGEVTGIAINRGRQRFVVEIADQGGQRITQRYVLSVLPADGKAKPEAEPAKPQPLTSLSIEEAQRRLPARRLIEPHMLTQALLDSIEYKPAKPLPEATEEAAPAAPAAAPMPALPDELPDVLSEAGIAQLKALLAPMVGVEYPNRALFKAALEAQACRFAERQASKTARAAKQSPLSPEQWQQQCPSAWQRAALEKNPVEASAPVPWQDLAATLLPIPWRDWVVEHTAEKLDPAARPDPQWQASGCNCLVSASNGEIYAYQPNWHNSKDAPPVDFSLYERIIAFGLPFDDDGNVTALSPSKLQLDFIRAAHTYGSKLDIAIYRNDWQFLRDLPDDHQDRVALQVAKQATRLIDTPLGDYGRRWHDWVPGIATDERVGDGLTLYLDNLPSDPALRKAFERFRDRLIKALIVELRRGEPQQRRQYTLNLMLNDYDFVSWAKAPEQSEAVAQGKGDAKRKTGETMAESWSPWSIDTLFDYLILAEDPRIENRRITSENGAYRSNTNVTLRYVVLLSEPTKTSKKSLRDFVEASPLLVGENRRTFLRKIFPLVSVGSATAEQFNDDMANFMTNFGGVALWPQPAAVPESPAGDKEGAKTKDGAKADPAADKAAKPKDKVYEAMAQSLRTTFLANEPKESAVCGWVCDHRWPLRAVFVVLMAVGVISFAAYFLSCRVRALGRPYQIYLVLGCLPPLIIGGLLLQCDPGLVNIRDDNTLLFALIGFLILSSIIPLLLPKVEKP